jgi:hypothetical protein
VVRVRLVSFGEVVSIDEGAVESFGELLHSVDYFGDSTGIVLIGSSGELIEGIDNYEVRAVVLEIFDVMDKVF